MKALVIFFFSSVNLFAQFNPPIEIAFNNYVASVHSVDLDGDGDIDILAAGRGDTPIGWYKNLDGLGNFSSIIPLADSTYGSLSITAADLDNDGDMDILVAVFDADSIAWFENLDGQGSFSEIKIINSSALKAKAAKAADLNGDGYKDILFVSRDDNKVAWHENLLGNGEFGPEQIISTENIIPNGVEAGDIDNDGDIDVVSFSILGSPLVWFENLDGNGSFGNENIIFNYYNPSSMNVCDLDNDGDLDITYTISSKLGWQENLDGQGNFSSFKEIDDGLSGANSLISADINNDGNLDLLISSGNGVYWYESLNGQGDFNNRRKVADINSVGGIFTSDINNDGLEDVIVAGAFRVFWIENTGILGMFQNNDSSLTLSPNPTSDFVIIENNTRISIINIFDIRGKLLTTIKGRHEIDLSNFDTGIYILKIEDDNGLIDIKKVLKR